MAQFTFTSPEGKNYTINAPQGATKEQAFEVLQQHLGQPHPTQSAQPETTDSGLAGMAGNALAGAASGAAQIGSTILSPVDWALKKAGLQREDFNRRAEIEGGLRSAGANPESMAFKGGEFAAELAGTAGAGGAIAKGVKFAPRLAQAIESGGFNVGDAATTLGGKVANAGLRVGGGAITGAAGAGAVNPDNVATGGAAGGAFGALSPVIGKAVTMAVSKYTKPNAIERVGMRQASVDTAIKQVADDLGISVKDVPDDLSQLIRTETEKALSNGNSIDASALARKSEFDKLGMTPMQGQITRDPTQYAQEFNMRGASPEIAGRLQEQNRKMQELFGNPAKGAKETYQAGNELADVLGAYNKTKQSDVSSLYKTARQSAGKDLELPLQGLAQDFADITGRYSDNVISNLPIKQFQEYGLMGVKQTKLYTVEEADKLMKVINSNQSNVPAVNSALSELRNAVRASVEAVDASGGVFAPAVNAAKARFKELDAIPALKAIADGNANPDAFVNKFVLKGKTDEVKRLADVLRNQSPDAFGQAKAQVADDIRRAAFGENMAGDGAVSPERLAKKLRELGTDKLSAFFSPQEIDQYNTAARVAAYISKHPNAAPVNTSNTLVAQLMANPSLRLGGKIAESIPGAGVVLAGAKAATGAVKNQMAATKAMNSEIAPKKLDLTESQRKLLAKVMGGMNVGAAQLVQ